MNHISIGKIWNRNEKVVDNTIIYTILLDLENKDEDPASVKVCQRRCDWLEMKIRYLG